MIRPATTGDIAAIVRIGAQMVDEGRYSHAGYSASKAEAFARHYIGSDRNLLVVSEEAGILTGFFFGFIAPFYFSEATFASEELWYVLPEYRGGRDGLRMISAFVEWAKANGVIEISAGVSLGVNNERAGRALRAFGFSPSGECYKRIV